MPEAAAHELQKTVDEITGYSRRTRKLFWWLAAIAVVSLALAAANVAFTVHQVSANDQKFCQVITGFTAVPVPKPADPAANPSREQSYEWYLRFADLGRSLGC